MRRLLAFVLAATAMPAAAQADADRDWAETLRKDAQALHDDIARNHPGPINPADPGFAARNDAQLALALERADTAASYGDYFFALREYVASFDDGHLGFGAFGAPPTDYTWPGFATRFENGGAMVVGARDDDAPVPLGARLESCDGMTADAYAAATLGRTWGRWQLESQRRAFGPMLFLSEGSRYIPRAARCTFTIDGETRDVALEWQPLSIERFRAVRQELNKRSAGAFEARTLSDGTRWFAIPSFDGDPSSETAKALPGIIAGLTDERSAIASAPAIVLDLRGNSGGSSDWSIQLADALWGRAALEAAPWPDVEVDWRASPTNLASIATDYAARRDGASQNIDHFYRSVSAGLGTAIARGEELWTHVSFDDGEATDETDDAEAAPSTALPALAAPVYVLTDGTCASACLDALDVWTALGAIQVGRTTSADTLYMEIRQARLPSGLTAASVPMKVYRGRSRGQNEPAVPRHTFDGDITDTDAVARWIAALPR